jgi:hypothetical protein
MRLILLLAVVAIVLFAIGWLYVRDTGETTEIILDKEEVKSDTETVVEEGRELIEETGGQVEELTDQPKDESEGEQPAGQKAEAPEKAPASEASK